MAAAELIRHTGNGDKGQHLNEAEGSGKAESAIPER